MKKQLPVFIALAIIAVSGCTKSNTSNTTPSQSAVMFVNAISSNSKLLVVSGMNNNTALTNAANLLPLTCSPYIDVTSGSSVSYAPFNGSNPVGSAKSVGTNQHYSFFAFGPIDSIKTLLAPDNLIIPDPGTAKVRFANFCSGNPKLACYFNGIKIDSPVAYGNVDPFFLVTPGTGMLLMQDRTQPTFTASNPDQTFIGGKLYTVMFTDTAINGETGFQLTVITNF